MPSRAQFMLDQMNEAITASQSKFKRSYLGASSIGSSCERALQYSFRHCTDSDFNAISLKRFEDGHHSEAVYIKRLLKAGFDLEHDEDGVQFGFSAVGGWFRGHRDGRFRVIPVFGESIWEHKSSKKWSALAKLVEKDESTALLKWNKIYYDQAQTYMGYSGIPYHITTAAGEGSREECICVTEFDQRAFDEIVKKAERIITSDRLMPKIGTMMTYDCKYCDAKDVCHEEVIPKPSCRNCAALDFKVDGETKAVCGRWSEYDLAGSLISEAAWEKDTKAIQEYYSCHMYMPELIGMEEGQMIKDNQGFSLQYENNGVTFKNGQGEDAMTSMDMYEARESKPWLTNAQKIKNAFDGKFEGWE